MDFSSVARSNSFHGKRPLGDQDNSDVHPSTKRRKLERTRTLSALLSTEILSSSQESRSSQLMPGNSRPITAFANFSNTLISPEDLEGVLLFGQDSTYDTTTLVSTFEVPDNVRAEVESKNLLHKCVSTHIAYRMPWELLSKVTNAEELCKLWRKGITMGYSEDLLVEAVYKQKLFHLVTYDSWLKPLGFGPAELEQIPSLSQMEDLCKLVHEHPQFNASLTTRAMAMGIDSTSLKALAALVKSWKAAPFAEALLNVISLTKRGFTLPELQLLERWPKQLSSLLDLYEVGDLNMRERALILAALRTGVELKQAVIAFKELVLQMTPDTISLDNSVVIKHFPVYVTMMSRLSLELQDEARQQFLSGIPMAPLKYALESSEKARHHEVLQEVETHFAGWCETLTANERLTKRLRERRTMVRNVGKFLSSWKVSSTDLSFKDDPSITLPLLCFKGLQSTMKMVWLKPREFVCLDQSGLLSKSGRIFIDPSCIAYITPIMLGQGTYGRVHTCVLNGEAMAAKVANSKLACSIDVLKDEYRHLQAIHHPNSVAGIQPAPVALFSSSNFCMMISELFSHSLSDEIHGKNGYGQTIQRLIPDRRLPHSALVCTSIAAQLIGGMKYLHDDKDLAHLDVKPQNMLIKRGYDGNIRAVIGDLGSVQPKTATKNSSPDFVGPTWWYAQESDVNARKKAFLFGQYDQYKQIMEGMDVYGLGVSFYELFSSGSLPFVGLTKKNVYPLPEQFNFDEPQLRNLKTPSELVALIGNMLNFDPLARPKFSQMVPRIQTIYDQALLDFQAIK